MFRLINKLKNRKGFTLIELIVVLAVLAIIMAIAVPRFMGVQQKAKEDSDDSTIAMVKKAAELYYVSEKDSTFTIGDMVSNGYLEEFALQADSSNDSYTKVKDDEIKITSTSTGQSVSIDWSK